MGRALWPPTSWGRPETCSLFLRRSALGRHSGRSFSVLSLWRRIRRVHSDESLLDGVPAHEHGVVLVLGVVAMLHIHAGKLPELHLDRDRAAGLQSVDILAAGLRRRGLGTIA